MVCAKGAARRTRGRRSTGHLQIVVKIFSFGIRFAKHKAMGSEVPVPRFAGNKLEKLAIRYGKDQDQKTWMAEHGNIKNKDGQSTQEDKQKLNKQKRMESGVPGIEMSPNKVQWRAIGLGKDVEQRSRVAEQENIKNKDGRSKNL